MVHKSRTQKKKFNCGHVGYGKYCHLCRDVKEGRLVKTRQGKYLPSSEVNSEDEL